jgi:hypothetical protein
MKCFLFSALIFFTPWVSAQVGYKCEELNLEISKEDAENIQTLVIRNILSGEVNFNAKITFNMNQTTQAYQQRYGIYHMLMAEAQLHFPIMPEFLMIYHLNASSRAFKKGFDAFEGKTPAIKLKKMYCKALIKAIEGF